MSDTGHSTDTPDDVVPLDGDEGVGFDVVRFGGYDRRQVDDYLDRVEVALNEADQRHAHDRARVTGVQAELAAVQERLAEAERRAAGQPEAASVVTGRMAQMLALAEQEAEELRTRSRTEAERLVAAGKEQAAQESSALLQDLQRRERELAASAEAAQVLTVKAERDAGALRAQSKRDGDNQLATAKREAEAARVAGRRDADKLLEQARQDVQGLHEQARREAAEMTAEARRQVEQLSRQRDAIAAQMQQLRDAVSAAVAPLSVASADASGRAPGAQPGSARV